MLALSCTDNDTTGTPSLTVEPSQINFAASGNASQTITVSAANVAWTAEMSDASREWIFITVSDNSIEVSVADNEQTEPRNGSITITPDNPNVDPKRVSIIQAGAELADISISVSPSALTFAGEGSEPQTFTVTVEGGDTEWTAVPEDAIADWVTATADGNTVTVTVTDNPATTQRSGNITVTPANENVAPKVVRVTQEGTPLKPSISVSKTEITFDDRATVWTNVGVTVVETQWSVRTSTTADGTGPKVDWFSITNISINEDMGINSFDVTPTINTTTSPRTGYVIVEPTNPDLEAVVITVTQEAGQEYITSLLGDLEITDLAASPKYDIFFTPNQLWDHDSPAEWQIQIYASTAELYDELYTYDNWRGSGSRLTLYVRAANTPHNDAEEYYLPNGTYTVVSGEEYENTAAPNTIQGGRYSTDLKYPNGSWYMNVTGENTFNNSAPIVSGSMEVSRSGETYTFTFNFKDDADQNITGTCVTPFEKEYMAINWWEWPDPNEGSGGDGNVDEGWGQEPAI